MIKLIVLFLLSNAFIYANSFWTLTGVTKASIYVENKVAYIDPATIKKAKEKMLKMFESAEIRVDLPDSPTLILDMQDIQNDEDHYVYLKLSLGEEVTTFRDTRDGTYALTYQTTDFIETDAEDLNNAILESVDSLLATFIEQFEDDKE